MIEREQNARGLQSDRCDEEGYPPNGGADLFGDQRRSKNEIF